MGANVTSYSNTGLYTSIQNLLLSGSELLTVQRGSTYGQIQRSANNVTFDSHTPTPTPTPGATITYRTPTPRATPTPTATATATTDSYSSSDCPNKLSQVSRSRLTALLTVPHRRFLGRAVQATPLLQLPHRTEPLGFGTYGVGGVTAWASRTLSLRPLTRLTRRNFTTQYYLTMSHGTGGTVSPASGWRNSGAAISISATPATGVQL